MFKNFFILNQQEIRTTTGGFHLDSAELVQQWTGVTRAEAEQACDTAKMLIGLVAIATVIYYLPQLFPNNS